MIAVDFKVAKESFFDRAGVLKSMHKAHAKAMVKAGAFVRRSARSSIRRSKKSAVAGQPPRAHSKDRFATIKNILFYYDKQKKTVIVGPVKLNGKKGTRYPVNQTVPQFLEFGGRAVQVLKNGKRRQQQQAPRPFMFPALARESPKFAGFYKNQLDRV